MYYNPPSSLKRKDSSISKSGGAAQNVVQHRPSSASNSPKRKNASSATTSQAVKSFSQPESALAKWGYSAQPDASMSTVPRLAHHPEPSHVQQNPQAHHQHPTVPGFALYYPPGANPPTTEEIQRRYGGIPAQTYATLQNPIYGKSVVDHAQVAFRSRTIDVGSSPGPSMNTSHHSAMPSRSDFGNYFSPIAGSRNHPPGLLEIVGSDPLQPASITQRPLSVSFSFDSDKPSSSIATPASARLLPPPQVHQQRHRSPSPSHHLMSAKNTNKGPTEYNLFFSPMTDNKSLRESFALSSRPDNSSMSDANISALTPRTLQSSYDGGTGNPFENGSTGALNMLDEVGRRQIHHGRVLSNISGVSAATASASQELTSVSVSPASASPSSSPRRRGNSYMASMGGVGSRGSMPCDVSVSSMASEDYFNLANSDGELVSPAQLTLPKVQSILPPPQLQQLQLPVAAKERRSSQQPVDLRAQHAAAIKQRKNAAKQERSSSANAKGPQVAEQQQQQHPPSQTQEGGKAKASVKPLAEIAEQSNAVIGTLDRAFDADLTSTFRDSMLSQQQLSTYYMSSQQQAAAAALAAASSPSQNSLASVNTSMSAAASTPKVPTKVSQMPPPPISEPPNVPQRAAIDSDNRYFPSVATAAVTYVMDKGIPQKAVPTAKVLSNTAQKKLEPTQSSPKRASTEQSGIQAITSNHDQDDSSSAGSVEIVGSSDEDKIDHSPVREGQRQRVQPSSTGRPSNKGSVGVRKSNKLKGTQSPLFGSSGNPTATQSGTQRATTPLRAASSSKIRNSDHFGHVDIISLPKADIDLGGGRKATISVAGGEIAEKIADQFISEHRMDSEAFRAAI